MDFQKITLSSGLEIVAEINPEVFSTALGFFVRTGSRHEVPGQAGMSHFLEHMVFKGNEHRAAEDVNRKFDEIGADVNAYTSEEQTVFHATLLPEMLDEGVRLLGALLKPALRPADIETEKLVVLEEMSSYDDQPPFAVDDQSREIFFAGHPLGNRILGTPESVKNLTKESIMSFWEQHYAPENMTLVVTGKLDFAGKPDFESLCRSVENSVATICDWPAASGGVHAISERRHVPGQRVFGQRGEHRVVRDAATQMYTLLLSDAPSCQDDNRFAASLLACIIGDEVGSRLFWELSDTGLVESVAMSTYEYHDNGVFQTGFSCMPEMMDRVLETVKRVFQTITQEGPTWEEWERAKNKTLSRLVLGNERPAGRLFSIGTDWMAGNGYRPLSQDLADIRAVTLDDLHDVLQQYPLHNPLLVTVGPTATFQNPFATAE